MTAHLFMLGTSQSDVKSILKNYQKRKGFNDDLFGGFCGTEILRRLIGIAQLPLELSIEEKGKLVKLAEYLILTK